MNKSLILVLAVCLVSVHAFVKRETQQPLSADTLYESTKKNLENLKKQVEDTINSDAIKKTLNDAFDLINETVGSFKVKSTEAPKA